MNSTTAENAQGVFSQFPVGARKQAIVNVHGPTFNFALRVRRGDIGRLLSFHRKRDGNKHRDEGDMAVQLVQEILNKPEIEVVAPLPGELGGHIDAVLAVSVRSTYLKEAADFIKFLTRPEAKAAWAAKGFKAF